jgi:outer membrane protein
VAWLILAVPHAARATDIADVFNTDSQVPKEAAGPSIPDAGEVCRVAVLSDPVTLFQAVERSLCESPKTHAAWAAVKAAAAGVGGSKAAYLPTLDGTASYSASHNNTEVKTDKALRTDYSSPVNVEGLSLSWLLYDFGGRGAALRASRDLLSASRANQDLVLQAVFANTAKDYYTAQAADAALKAAHEIEDDGRQIRDAATARYKTGLAPVTDQLLATTLAAQAVFQRVKAQGAQQVALGTLAIDMSLPADQALRLPELDQSVLPDSSFVQAVHDLIDEAIQSHPSIVAARAQWQAALEDVRTARAAGLPRISISGSVSRADQPLSASLGEPAYPGLTRQDSIGLSIEFPLFQGFAWDYKIRQAKAVADSGEQNLRDAQQQVQSGVWSSFQALATATENLHNTEIIRDSARDYFAAAKKRYLSGVGTLLEVLTAETTLATAEQQQVQAQLDWRTARILLAQNLGHLGLWAVQGQ